MRFIRISIETLLEGRAMFERFTDRANRVVVLAYEEARLCCNYIGSAHILIGLMREDNGIAVRAIADSGYIAVEAVRAMAGQGAIDQPVVPTGRLDFSPQAIEVLNQSGREAQQLGHDYIGTEHILLGLLGVESSTGASILKQLGVDFAKLRQRVLDMVAASEPAT